MLAATALGTLALFGFASASSLGGILAMQCVAGGLWGVIFGTAANAAIDAGHVGREGCFTGLVFALSALAAPSHGLPSSRQAPARHPEIAALLPWLPPLAWSVAAILLALFVAHNLAYLAGRMHATRCAADSG
ncbi:hypothetical protein ACU4GD_11640 [Cupriavidus basilensis]